MPTSIYWQFPGWLQVDRIQADWWGLDPVTPPADEPITIDDVKKQARATGNFEDTIIAGYLVAARMYVEKITNRFMLPQTWDFWLQRWPASRIYIPRAPLISVSSVNYTDTAEQSNVVPTSIYDVNTTGDPGSVVLQFGQVWPPGPLSPGKPINIRFAAGYPRFASVVNVNGSAVTWQSGDHFDPTWTPMGWVVINGLSYPLASVQDSTHLTLASSVGGNLANASFAFNLVPQPLKLAMLLLASHWYGTREPIVVGRGLVSVEIAKTFDSLIDAVPRVSPMGFAQIYPQG